MAEFIPSLERLFSSGSREKTMTKPNDATENSDAKHCYPSPYDAIIKDRVHRGDNMAVGKHKAANAAYCERIIRRLQSNGQHEEADMIVWLLWWRAMDSQTAKQVDEMRLEEIAQLREQIDAMDSEEHEGWCGHCACQSCYDAKRKADHW